MSARQLLFLLALFSGTTMASSHMVVAPECLLAQTKPSFKMITGSSGLKLVATDEKGIAELITAKNKRQKGCGGFIDVSADWEDYGNKSDVDAFLADYSFEGSRISLRSIQATKYKIQYTREVEQLLTQINPQLMWGNLTTLSSFNDRYANSDDGVKAANWLRDTVMGYAHKSMRDDISAYFVKTGSAYKQPSLVIKIGTSDEPGVVVGAHMDTLSGRYSPKPGADDDGSGTSTVLEAARTLINSGMQFKKPIYIIWYAAEEEGLVGSGFVVKDFKQKNIPVSAVIRFDLTGFAYRNEPTMWLITDNVNPKLTNYLGRLIKQYVKKPFKSTACGYACSDHATWTKNGYAAAIPAETAYENTNPDIHSSEDTIDKLSLDHMTDYTKLAVAFAVELAEPLS